MNYQSYLMREIYINQIQMKNSSITALLLVAIAVVGVTLYSKSVDQESIPSLYNQWKSKHNIGNDFTVSENLYRMKVFEQTLEEINTHNSLLGRSYELGLNQFSALTKAEFAAQFLTEYKSNGQYVEVESIPNGPIVDWVSKGAVSPVKNQGSCLASYAFSAVGAIEGISVLYYNRTQQYSVQQVVDCSSQYGNNGCINGRMDWTFNYVRNVGINTWASYPYNAQLGSCRTNNGTFRVNGSVAITDCNNLANALLGRPISVVVDGSNMQSYRSGIFGNCGTNLSLPTLLVGMNDSWWNLKNSWGVSWGESGYIRLYRGNTCGVCLAGVYPLPL